MTIHVKRDTFFKFSDPPPSPRVTFCFFKCLFLRLKYLEMWNKQVRKFLESQILLLNKTVASKNY